jgi:serine/threonine protein kinase
MLTTKVLDFGISVVLERAWRTPLQGQLLPTHGTPAYMSPEHIQGLADIDARADVYGFGVLLFESLTGQLPFLGEPGPELFTRILHERAPKVTLFRPDLSATIAGIVERALAKDPRDRFPGLDALVEAIEDHLLPPSPLPRSLTPMAGVPLFALSEPRSGVADPVVQVRQSTEPAASQDHDATDTKELFPLAKAGETRDRSASRKIVPITDSSRAVAGSRPTDLEPDAPAARPLVRLLTQLALFGGILLVIAWLAFPSVPSQEEISEPPRERRPPSASAPGQETPKAMVAPDEPTGQRGLAPPDGGR